MSLLGISEHYISFLWHTRSHKLDQEIKTSVSPYTLGLMFSYVFFFSAGKKKQKKREGCIPQTVNGSSLMQIEEGSQVVMW